MSFQIVTEPIDHWPLPDTANRSPIQFKAPYDKTLRLLNKELEYLDTHGRVVIQVVTRNGAADLRRDGALRSQAKIDHPGVRLSFTCRHGDLTYATDQYQGLYYSNMPDWQANLRAIALGLEALRTVDRYGITKTGEQYRGWQALESGPAKLTPQQAMEVFRQHAGPTYPAHGASVDALYRLAKAATHPDRNGGMRGPWDDVERAAKALGLI